jgi:FkbM family methyltransferase
MAGWRGINIDPMPGSMAAFHKHRGNDVNLEIGVSETTGTAKLYLFNERAVNTLEGSVAEENSRRGWHIEGVAEVPIRSLREILTEHRPSGPIDLLTIDTEGHDLSVLRSNDWKRFRPKVVLTEAFGRMFDDLQQDPCVKYMAKTGYQILAKTVNTVMYVENPL